MDFGIAETFIVIFCTCVVLFCIYLLYVWYLKKYKAYKFPNGVPDAAILRPSRIGSAGFKHFSAAPFRASQLRMGSTDDSSHQSPRRPHTFPLSGPHPSPSRLPSIPEIHIHHV